MLTKYDKAGATVIAGAIATIIVFFYPMDMEMQAALQTAITALMVWAFPNKVA